MVMDFNKLFIATKITYKNLMFFLKILLNTLAYTDVVVPDSVETRLATKLF